MFYQKRCGHCHQLAPTWQRLAENMAAHVEIAAVDCEEANDMCSRYQISGVPSLKMFTLSAADDQRLVLDYAGARDLAALAAYAKTHATSFVFPIKPAAAAPQKGAAKRTTTLDGFMGRVDQPRCRPSLTV